jgi:hypothetical protein
VEGPDEEEPPDGGGEEEEKGEAGESVGTGGISFGVDGAALVLTHTERIIKKHIEGRRATE